MPEPTNQPAPPVGPLAAAHAAHDRLLVAAYASNDLDAAARSAAADLVAGCSACAELAADLRALATATAALPVPPRRRDFRLSPADAARLRPRGLRRVLAALAAAAAVTRPLAAGLTTLGVAGLLLAALPGILPQATGGAASGQGPSAAQERSSGGEGQSDVQMTDETRAPAASRDAAFAPPADTSGGAPSGAPEQAPDAAPDQVPDAALDPNQAATPGAATDDPPRATTSPDEGPSPLALLSIAFLVAGIALFALRRVAARAT